MKMQVVGERSVSLRRWFERTAGGIRSANADMSNVKAGEKPARRKPKVSCSTSPLAVSPRFPALRSSEQGESAPKARLRSVVDGKQINISAPCASAMGGRSAKDHPGVGCPGLRV